MANISSLYKKHVREQAPDCASLTYRDFGTQRDEPCSGLCHVGSDTLDLCNKLCGAFLECVKQNTPKLGESGNSHEILLGTLLPICVLVLGVGFGLLWYHRARLRNYFTNTDKTPTQVEEAPNAEEGESHPFAIL